MGAVKFTSFADPSCPRLYSSIADLCRIEQVVVIEDRVYLLHRMESGGYVKGNWIGSVSF